MAFGALWVTSAGVAVGLGFFAVSTVDVVASSQTAPAAATGGTEASSSQVPSTPTASSVPTPSPTPAPVSSPAPSSAPASTEAPPPPEPAAVSGEQETVGGTVYASCTGGALELATAPAEDWWVQYQDDDEVGFLDGGQWVAVRASCTDGIPTFTVDGPADGKWARPDDGHRPVGDWWAGHHEGWAHA
ncbi:hypothetical protein DQ238_05715 [Geodermatophilus sp. TF02-6]|nr:hypothetical protein DQ238_05715 [Geodermatophilus sp. TF02-6]